jgi:hypothetical protein
VARVEADIAAVSEITIANATGRWAAKVNGVYRQVSESTNGKPVFAKVGGEGAGVLCCCYAPCADWEIVECVNKDDDNCKFARSNGNWPLHPAVSSSWNIRCAANGNEKFIHQPDVTVEVSLTEARMVRF